MELDHAEQQAQAIVDRSGEENLQQRALWREAIANAIRDAVAAEREACAKIVEDNWMLEAPDVAKEIRARK